jgi:hypothetical protein
VEEFRSVHHTCCTDPEGHRITLRPG